MSGYKSYERTISPVTIINSNGSRYTAPIDILRSEAGRAEIMRQRSGRAVADETEHGVSSGSVESGDRDKNR